MTKSKTSLSRILKHMRHATGWVGLLLLALMNSSSTNAETVPLVKINPAAVTVAYAESFQVSVRVEDVNELWAYGITINYPVDLITLISVVNGGFLEEGISMPDIDPENGIVQFDLTQLAPALPKSGSGNLVILNFQARDATGLGALELITHDLVGTDIFPIAHNVLHGQVNVCETGQCNLVFLPMIYH